MIERVARNIASERGLDPDSMVVDHALQRGRDHQILVIPSAEWQVPAWKTYYSTARAAIEAMREPAGHMVAAAWADYENSPKGVLVEEFSVGRDLDDLTQDTAYEVWQAMIDAALKEPA